MIPIDDGEAYIFLPFFYTVFLERGGGGAEKMGKGRGVCTFSCCGLLWFKGGGKGNGKGELEKRGDRGGGIPVYLIYVQVLV